MCLKTKRAEHSPKITTKACKYANCLGDTLQICKLSRGGFANMQTVPGTLCRSPCVLQTVPGTLCKTANCPGDSLQKAMLNANCPGDSLQICKLSPGQFAYFHFLMAIWARLGSEAELMGVALGAWVRLVGCPLGWLHQPIRSSTLSVATASL